MDSVKHIFFDLDHTLWDFDKNSEEALIDIYAKLNLAESIPSFQRFLKKYREVLEFVSPKFSFKRTSS